MTIKRKDGSDYKLQGPNPIMFSQSLWDDQVSHYFHHEEFISKEPEKHRSLEDIDVEEIYVPIKEVPADKLPNKPKKEPKAIPKETVHYLPAEIKENFDPLYGESRITITYGQKTTLELIILQKDDLTLSAWCTTQPTNNSIIYKDKRWWKITNTTEQNNGYIITCAPSDLQPSFD